MVFGQEFITSSMFPYSLAVIRRTWQIGACGVKLVENAGDNLTGYDILIRVDIQWLQRPAHGQIILIVARPKNQGCVIAKFEHHRSNLLLDHFSEIVPLRIECTAHPKILPYENPVFIAKVKEGGIFVNIASPTADHIAIDIHSHIDHGIQMRFVPAMQCVHRYPVGSVNEYGFIIHYETELSGFTGKIDVIHIQFYGADSDFAIISIQLFTIRTDQLYTGIVEGCIAITSRPPEIGIIQFEYMAESRSAYYLRILIYDFPFTAESELSFDFIKFVEGHD